VRSGGEEIGSRGQVGSDESTKALILDRQWFGRKHVPGAKAPIPQPFGMSGLKPTLFSTVGAGTKVPAYLENS
jgi:hypothetical protein